MRQANERDSLIHINLKNIGCVKNKAANVNFTSKSSFVTSYHTPNDLTFLSQLIIRKMN